MKGIRWLARVSESFSAALLVLGLVAPLLFFFERVRPWEHGAGALLAKASVRAAIVNTLLLAGAVATLSTGLAFLFSWVLWRFDWRPGAARAATLLLKIPYLLPSFFLAFGWIVLAAPRVGALNRLAAFAGLPPLPELYGLGGTLFVETLWTTALAMIQLQGFFARYPGQLEDAAILCGASPARALRSVTLRLALPQLAACWLLAAMSAAAAYGVPAMLASPARRFVLTTKIVQSIKSSHDFSQAGLLSLGLLALAGGLLLLQAWVGRRGGFALVGGKAGRPSPLRPRAGARALLAGSFVFGTLATVLPCGAIVIMSLLRDPSDLMSFTLSRYVTLASRTPDAWLAIGNSLATSLSAALVATVLGLFVAFSAARLKRPGARLLVEIWNVGFALPGTVIALCLMVFYASSLMDTLWILSLAYLVKYSAFALRTIAPAAGGVGRELEEAAWMCGASPLQAFARIFVPLLRPAIAAAAVLAFVPMLSELTMSVLLVGPGTDTLGALIFKLQEYADPGAAAALTVCVMAAILALNGLLRRFAKGEFGI